MEVSPNGSSERAPGAASKAPVQATLPLHRRLDRLVAKARAAILVEKGWPALWPAFGVVLAFLSLSWLGLWLDLATGWRIAGVALFGLALLGALLPLARLRWPDRGQALDRVDRDAGLGHRPARALEDTLALGSGDAGTRALWDLHRRRAEAAVAHLTVAPPRPDMPRHDRHALRAGGILAAIACAFVAGPEIGSRLSAAFDWRGPVAPAPTFRVDGWIDPPHYTRIPPLMIDLASGEQRLKAPVGSIVVIRVAGRGRADVTPTGGLKALPVPEPAAGSDLREQRFTLTGDADLSVTTGLTGGMKLALEAIPDRAPEIAFVGRPETNQHGTFTIAYKAEDDYGVTAIEGLVANARPQAGRRTLVPAPKITLPPPADSRGDAESRAPVDLADHPWAGARVKLTLVARDELGQEGSSETIDFTLPQRPFTQPLAKALVEQRRNLVLDPDDRRRVQLALDSLLIEPDRFTPQWGVFLGLRIAATRLRAARSDADLTEVADWLWTMATQIEDGDLSDAERQLRAAQERLREAMERGASDDEIKRLSQELRQAMDRYLKEFAQRQPERQKDAQESRRPTRTITQGDLDRMLNRIEELMKQGQTAEAMRLLEAMRNIMENLQTARPGSRMTDPTNREMNQAMDDLDAMAQDQQRLRDETFSQGQERQSQRGERNRGRQQQGQRGQQGQRAPGQQGQQGEQDQGEQGQGERQGQGQGQGLSQRQQALRQKLEDLQRRMRGLGMEGEQGLKDAEEAMREAENQLGQGEDGRAVGSQGRAIEGLRRGMQGMAQQMERMMGEDGEGEPGQQGSPRGRASNDPTNDDPLGRPTRNREMSDGRVRVPEANESAVERARRIMEELRRKLGEPMRQREELDYFERLLRPN